MVIYPVVRVRMMAVCRMCRGRSNAFIPWVMDEGGALLLRGEVF